VPQGPVGARKRECRRILSGFALYPAHAEHLARGTDGSNPSRSRGESTNHRFRRRFHGLEITKEKQRVSEALARVPP
jgi:hypothetical protein